MEPLCVCGAYRVVRVPKGAEVVYVALEQYGEVRFDNPYEEFDTPRVDHCLDELRSSPRFSKQALEDLVQFHLEEAKHAFRSFGRAKASRRNDLGKAGVNIESAYLIKSILQKLYPDDSNDRND